MDNKMQKTKYVCEDCGAAATCYKGTMYLCDECLLKSYNKKMSENKQCIMCGTFGIMQFRNSLGEFICSLKCLKKYFGYKDIAGD